MEAMSDTLYRLFYDREFRESFTSGKASFSGDFATIDLKQLERFGEAIESNTFTSPLIAGKSLEDCFANTIAQLQGIAPTFRQLFLTSEAFTAYSDLNHSEKFPSLEEAFYCFASETHAESEPLARHEYLTAHMQMLATHKAPAFRVNFDFVQPLSNGFISLQAGLSQTQLYACVQEKFISGPIDDSVVAVLKKYFVKGTEEIAAEDAELVEGLKGLGFETRIN
jgi:hypothetical protein